MDEPIVDPVAPEPATTTEPASTPDPAATGAEPSATSTSAEPSDLEAYLAEQLKEEKPADGAVDPNAAPVATEVSDQFKEVLGISEYVKSPEHVSTAIRAAAEVWDVAAGKIPASQMLEGMRAGNPEGFERAVNDLIPYIEKLTGQKFGAADPNAAPDPVAELRAEIAAQEQQRQLERQQQAYTQTVNQVMPIFKKAIADTLGKQFGDGDEQYFIGRIAQIVPEAKMVDALAKGDMKPLEAAMKQVKTEELTRFKRWSDHLIKQSKDFRKSVPAAKGGSQPSATGAPLTSTGWTREQSAEFLRTGVAPE